MDRERKRPRVTVSKEHVMIFQPWTSSIIIQASLRRCVMVVASLRRCPSLVAFILPCPVVLSSCRPVVLPSCCCCLFSLNMEVHDFDQEHLESILKDDDEHEANETTSSIAPHVHADAAHRPPTTTACGEEGNTSKERYALLPDYAQEGFTKKSDETNADAILFQDLRQDVEQNLPKNIKTAVFVSLVPITKRSRDMVRITAAKCVSAPQLEVMLKVKQADNPEFAFLKPDNDCHAYFLWLKEEQERTKREKEAMERAGGMDLLGMYSSSSDEEQSAAENEKVTQSEPCEKDSTVSIEDSQEVAFVTDILTEETSIDTFTDEAVAKRAKRLRRAKLLRGHYRLQLMEGAKTDKKS